ncbi:MAG: homocitrate synthase/isopropylmalate synthase family protein, partial [Streptosporangiaceae bacterium]
HNDLGMAVANSVSGALGDLDAGQDAWVNTCVNGIGERAGNADLLSCILALSHGFGLGSSVSLGDALDLSWARRFGLWTAYAFGQPLPPAWPGVGRNAFAHESGIHADGALKDRGNYELYDDSVLGPFPSDWYTREGRVVLTGEYGGKAGFRHVLDGLGIEVASGTEDLVFSLVQLRASATGRQPRLIAGYTHQLALREATWAGRRSVTDGSPGPVAQTRPRSVRNWFLACSLLFLRRRRNRGERPACQWSPRCHPAPR